MLRNNNMSSKKSNNNTIEIDLYAIILLLFSVLLYLK